MVHSEVAGVYLGMGFATKENIREFDLLPFEAVTFISSPITDESLATMELNLPGSCSRCCSSLRALLT